MTRTRLHGALRGMVVVLALGLGPVAVYAQAEPDEGQEAAPSPVDVAPTEPTDVAVAAGPTLQCNILGLRVMAPEMGGARFVCLVDGAAPGDATFSVQATPSNADPQFAARLRAATCTGDLIGGTGTCSGIFLDRASTALGAFNLAATLQPSGATAGPVFLTPETTPPAVRTDPFAPTAPMNTFPPLPEP